MCCRTPIAPNNTASLVLAVLSSLSLAAVGEAEERDAEVKSIEERTESGDDADGEGEEAEGAGDAVAVAAEAVIVACCCSLFRMATKRGKSPREEIF